MAETKVSTKKVKEIRRSKNSKTNIRDHSVDINVSGSEDTDGDEFGKSGIGTSSATVSINRTEYLEAIKELNHDYQQLKLKNNLLHRKMADYYKKRKLEHVLKPLEGAHDLEEKYQQKLFAYEELKLKGEKETVEIQSKVQAVEIQYEDRLQQAMTKFNELQNYERTTGTGLIYSKKGKPIAEKTVERFLTLQKLKREQASALCLRYVRVRNAVSELEAIVRKLESVGPGLYVAQYEQLYIDKQNYMTKIEERDDELIKNRNKCTEHNQILAHIREKMHHTDEVIDFTEGDFGDAELEFLKAREELGQVKGHRDRLRWLLEQERLKAGLLTRKDLLRDFQDATDEVVDLKEKKSQLEAQIDKTTRNLRETRNQLQFHHNHKS